MTITGNAILTGAASVHQAGGHQHIVPVAVSDDFNRTNSTGLGANWAAPTGGTQLDVVSNEAKAAVAGVLLSYWAADVFDGDHYSEVQYPANFNGNLWRGPAVRMQAGAQSCYLVEIVITLDEYDAFISSSVYLRECTAGSLATLASVLGSAVDYRGLLLKLEASGTSLTVKRATTHGGSWTEVTSATDASLSDGAAGLSGATPSRADNWYGGDL